MGKWSPLVHQLYTLQWTLPQTKHTFWSPQLTSRFHLLYHAEGFPKRLNCGKPMENLWENFVIYPLPKIFLLHSIVWGKGCDQSIGEQISRRLSIGMHTKIYYSNFSFDWKSTWSQLLFFLKLTWSQPFWPTTIFDTWGFLARSSTQMLNLVPLPGVELVI